MEVTVTWIGTGRKTYNGSTYEVDVTVKDQDGNDVLYHFTTTTFFTEKGNNRVAISIDVDSSNYRLASGSYTDDILVIE